MTSKASKDLTGKRFGRWTVLRRAERMYYYICRCDCGREGEVYYASLLGGKSLMCQSCSSSRPNPATTETAFRKAQQKVGQTINGWCVVDVLREQKKHKFLCVAVCPKCGKKVKAELSSLTKIQKCAECSHDIGKKSDAIRSATCVGKSSLSVVQSRFDGRINKNSTTGANGVSRISNGRYRAYINFQRRQYHLGQYATLEEAIAARKEAEALIYAPYLKEHAGWEAELANKLSELKCKK